MHAFLIGFSLAMFSLLWIRSMEAFNDKKDLRLEGYLLGFLGAIALGIAVWATFPI